MTTACQIYRHYDRQGCLLYLGVTEDMSGRQSQHRSNSKWAKEICLTLIDRYPDRVSALTSERVAILVEKPLHNKRKPTVFIGDDLTTEGIPYSRGTPLRTLNCGCCSKEFRGSPDRSYCSLECRGYMRDLRAESRK